MLMTNQSTHPGCWLGPARPPRRHYLATLLLIAASLTPASAAEPAAIDWAPVDAATLAQARGGFIVMGSLEVSLGIERLVTLNGDIVSRTSLTIPDVSKLSAEQAREAGQALSAINLVRNGTDSMTVPVAITAVPGATLIQNSVNGQHIDSRTVINSSVNTLGLLTSRNFQDSLGEAIARSARPF
jgi:hypothetical protein